MVKPNRTLEFHFGSSYPIRSYTTSGLPLPSTNQTKNDNHWCVVALSSVQSRQCTYVLIVFSRILFALIGQSGQVGFIVTTPIKKRSHIHCINADLFSYRKDLHQQNQNKHCGVLQRSLTLLSTESSLFTPMLIVNFINQRKREPGVV